MDPQASTYNSGGGLNTNPIGLNPSVIQSTATSMSYNCADCAYVNSVKAGEPIRCFECGLRIFLKIRTNRVTQFEAR